MGSDEAPGRNVSGLVREAEGGGIWIATSDQGAFRWDGASSFERFGTAEGLPDARVWAAFEDREGILWFGTDSGLAKRGPAAFRTFGPEDGLPAASPLYSMAETPDGALWIGAHDRGLVRRSEDGAVRVFTAKDGLPHTEVRSFCVSPSGDVIVATSRGAARISGDRVSPYPLPEGAPRVIDDIAFSQRRCAPPRLDAPGALRLPGGKAVAGREARRGLGVGPPRRVRRNRLGRRPRDGASPA